MPRSFFPLLVLSLVACCVEIDMSVPGFPDMAKYFGVSDGTIQMTIAYNFLGFCAASFLYGPLSEAWGRRPLMVWGNILLTVGALGCVFAQNIDLLQIARFIQGMGASASAVLVFAIIADVYKGQEMMSKTALMNALLTSLMAVAPVIGSFINETLGWRGNYAVVFLICLVSLLGIMRLLPETHLQKTPLKFKVICGDFKTLLKSWRFLKMALVPSILCAGYFCFIGTASFLYMEVFQVSIYWYAISQAAVVGLFSLVSIYAGRIMAAWGNSKTLKRGLLGTATGGLWLVTSSLIFPESAITFTLGMVLFAGGFALVYPLVFGASLQIFTAIKGTAASMVMALRAFLITVGVGIASSAYADTALSVALPIGLIIALGVSLSKTFVKDPLFAETQEGFETNEVHLI